MPPLGNRDWLRPGANIINPSATINRGNSIVNNPRDGMDAVTAGVAGHGVNGFLGGWTALSVADAIRQYDFARGTSSVADVAKGWYDREYARDLLNRWPWWSGGDWGSGSSAASGSGYGNPYYDSGYTNPYSTDAGQGNDSSANPASQERNDSQATSEASKENSANSNMEMAAAKHCMEMAVLAFQKGDYDRAQNQCEAAIRLVPGDANLQQFRALCHFAESKYKDAAATLYPILSAGPGWEWTVLRSFYENGQTYTKQLRALEEYVREHPKDAAARFVLAYHYLVLDERAAAVDRLQEVVKLQPKDQVSAGILKALQNLKKGIDGAKDEKPAPGR